MKNLLILIVATALFLHFYPQPEVTKFYNDQKKMLLDGFSEFSDTKVRLKADKIFVDLKAKLSQFSAEEVEYLKEVTSSRANVKSFFEEYCKSEKRSAIFHSDNQIEVCQTISQYESML
ncbi:hypothetical protein [Candidatus Colwellia aromaticivorans]|uniref:hypothetical protein n=1 Tax=Candidatus Colwellia aromaticivorans TaxID=2267621 RepID=UPI000DF48E66|nr:hypothetical protein [Candidatus Colwellia aromaticivorans]